MIVCGKSEL